MPTFKGIVRDRSSMMNHLRGKYMPDKIKSNSSYGITSNVIYSNLKNAILNGNLVAGQQLKQSNIAKENNVSAIPVREAFKMLSADGLVEIIERKGTIVRTVSIDEVLKTLNIRYNVEPLALSWAIPHLGVSEINKAKELNEQQKQEQDILKRVLINKELHLTLIRPSQFEPLINFIEFLFNKSIISPQTRLLHELDIVGAIDDHSDVIKHCEMFNVHEAITCLKEHINQAKLRINQTKKSL